MRTKKVEGGTIHQEDGFTSFIPDGYIEGNPDTYQGFFTFKCGDPKIFERVKTERELHYEFKLFDQFVWLTGSHKNYKP